MYLATNLSTGVTKNTIGWSSSVQDISASRPYLYNYEIIKYSDNTTEETDVALIGRWGMDGENGQDGASPAPVFRGNYSSTKYYYGNPHRVDIVKYNSVYYVARIDAPSGSGGFVGQAPTNTNYWNPFGASFESVATQLLLAENANIAGWVFRNGKLYSQNNSCYLDGKTGDVNIQGNFTGKISTVNAGNRIVIDPSSNSIIIYNKILGKDIEIMRIEAEDIGFGLRRPKITMNELSTETGGDITNKLIVSAYEIGLYRYGTGDNLIPMFQVTGSWSAKKVILSDYVLPSSRPSIKGQIYRNGDTLKIVT